MDERSEAWLDSQLAVDDRWVDDGGFDVDGIEADAARLLVESSLDRDREPVAVDEDPGWLDGIGLTEVADEDRIIVVDTDLDGVHPVAPVESDLLDESTMFDRMVDTVEPGPSPTVDPFDSMLEAHEASMVVAEPEFTDEGAVADDIAPGVRHEAAAPPAVAASDVVDDDVGGEPSPALGPSTARLDAFDQLDDPGEAVDLGADPRPELPDELELEPDDDDSFDGDDFA